jgi:hypothetical protein
METSGSKPVRIGYRYGLILFVCGIVIVGINVAMILISKQYFPKMMTVGVAISLLAPIFFVFPGGQIDKMPETKDMGKGLFKNAPMLHKIMWIVWGIAAVIIAVLGLIAFDPNFWK